MYGTSPHPETTIPALTSGRLLARNTLINLLGQGAPMLVALFSIPILIREMGMERFGILTLAWMVIGYFSLFDLGLSRALTQLVAERMGKGEERDVPSLTWTALSLMGALGVVGAVLLAVSTPPLVRDLLRIPASLQEESLQAFYLLALSLPWVITTAGLRGLLEAAQRFDLVNVIRLPMGVLTFMGPLLALPFTNRLDVVVAVLMAGRLAAWGVHLWFCLRTFPLLRRGVVFHRGEAAPLLRFGGWMTVSNLVGPLMVYLDRFVIGATISMAAVAYYVTPYEIVTKLWLVTAALLGVLFPAFAASFLQDPGRTALLFDRGVRVIFVAVFPATLVLVTLAHEGLDLWVGRELAVNGTRVLQWLAVGVFVNTVGQVAYAVIQGVGRPDITGKIHLVELPFYLVALWWLVDRFGVEGAAVAWTARVAVDTVALLVVATRFLPSGRAIVRRVGGIMGVAVLVLGVAALLTGLVVKWVFLLGVLSAFGLVAWRWILTQPERALIQGLARGWLPFST